MFNKGFTIWWLIIRSMELESSKLMTGLSDKTVGDMVEIWWMVFDKSN